MTPSFRRTAATGTALVVLTTLTAIPIALIVRTQQAPLAALAAPTPPAWVARSNQNAQVLLAVMARFDPEAAGGFGIAGLDQQIIDLQPRIDERRNQALRRAAQVLSSRLAREKNPLVRQDLEILIKAAQENVRASELATKYRLPYFDVNQLVFGGLRVLLDDQVSPQRRQAALVRLRRYAGLEKGYTPLAVLAEQRTKERLNQPGLIGPSRAEVEKNLANAAFLVDGIDQLFKQYQIAGYQEPYAKLKQQLAAYDAFVRKEVLPQARTDFRQPPELYAFALKQSGIDIPPAELADMARVAFKEIQQQLQALAPRVAKQKGLRVTDYRDVIRALKQDQLVGKAILPHYRKRLQEIEAIIRRERLVTLPTRGMRIRLASAAESAGVPSPHLQSPRLLGNTGEMGEFVLPLLVPAPAGSQPGTTQKLDDFTFAAASWTLTAHEARPGHELQFASMIERGVSAARAIFAFNSVNVEGWGLYSEAIMQPYMPPDGQLISLQLRLLRAARAFLDPELQMGKVTPQEAMRLLKEDVVFSDAFANQEVERYTFAAPGQAATYFYGYIQLLTLRAETERALGTKFSQQKYHDFILAQGLLPPSLLRKAVLEKFVGTLRSTATWRE